MNLFVTADDVRVFANLEGVQGRYSNPSLESNILFAQSFFQRESGRLIEAQNGVTKTFTTEGRASIPIPDLRSVTAVTLQGTALTANSTYYLIEDQAHSGVYTSIQFRAFNNYRGGSWWLANPEWFDRNLDSALYQSGYGSLPNDLTITGNWGWASPPYDVQHAVKAMAAWLTKRGDAMLANAVFNPDGSTLDYSRLPEEMAITIQTYKGGPQVVAV